MSDPITAAVIAELNAIARAKVEVEAVLGRPVTMACDSAPEVYLAGLKALGHSTAGLDPLAAHAMWSIVRNRPKKIALMAQDTAASKKYADKFPGATKLKIR